MSLSFAEFKQLQERVTRGNGLSDDALFSIMRFFEKAHIRVPEQMDLIGKIEENPSAQAIKKLLDKKLDDKTIKKIVAIVKTDLARK